MRDRDDVEFEELFEASFGAVARTVFLIIGDREIAREFTQEAFVQALVHWKRVSRYDNPGGWVRRVAIRLAMRQRSRGSTVAPSYDTSASAAYLA